jgi:hypothetical protein
MTFAAKWERPNNSFSRTRFAGRLNSGVRRHIKFSIWLNLTSGDRYAARSHNCPSNLLDSTYINFGCI